MQYTLYSLKPNRQSMLDAKKVAVAENREAIILINPGQISFLQFYWDKEIESELKTHFDQSNKNFEFDSGSVIAFMRDYFPLDSYHGIDFEFDKSKKELNFSVAWDSVNPNPKPPPEKKAMTAEDKRIINFLTERFRPLMDV